MKQGTKRASFVCTFQLTPSMSQLASLYTELKRAFEKKPSDLPKCGKLLNQLKLGLIQSGLLLPSGTRNLDDLVVAREHLYSILMIIIPIYPGDILEIGAFWSIRSKDVPSFDRYFSQLQTFYTDYR